MRWLLVILLCIASQHAAAFGRTGHYTVCDLAYQLSQPQTQRSIDKLVAKSGKSSLAKACSWADEVRSDAEFEWSAPLHYVNFPRTAAHVTMADCPDKGCILSGIADMRKRLTANKHDWQALLFLAHFIGDLHQPLHVSYQDDLGGNRTAVYFFGLPNNLHGVWDFALLKHAGYEDQPNKAQRLLSRITDLQRQQWQQDDVLGWANESADITAQIYQQYRAGMLLDDTYVTEFQPVLELRIQQAAVRLAMLLDQLFGAN